MPDRSRALVVLSGDSSAEKNDNLKRVTMFARPDLPDVFLTGKPGRIIIDDIVTNVSRAKQFIQGAHFHGMRVHFADRHRIPVSRENPELNVV